MSKPFVLLTGATGFIGFRVLTRALQAGYCIRVAVRNQTGFDRIKSLGPVTPYLDQIESIIVPDITASGAYDEAVQDVEYIIHVASPTPNPTITDFDRDLNQPARQGTVGILESAYKRSGIKKIVITASAASIISAKDILLGSDGTLFTEKNRITIPTGPYNNAFEAYMASKVVALEATETFIREKKPTFDVINIGPGCVIGRDDTVTELTDITKGTNHVAMGQLLGEPLPYALGSLVTHLDDVAKAHVEALNADITGNHFFLISAEGPGGPTWDSALEIVKRRYPKEVADGVFKMDAATETLRVRADSSYAEKTLGFKLKSYEEAVVSMVDHYLELIVRI